MEFKGTKGKWVNTTPINSNGYQNIGSEDGFDVATCYGGFEMTIPNAKLIVAAPEMFERLKNIAIATHEIPKWLAEEIHEIEQLLTKITQLK